MSGRSREFLSLATSKAEEILVAYSAAWIDKKGLSSLWQNKKYECQMAAVPVYHLDRPIRLITGFIARIGHEDLLADAHVKLRWWYEKPSLNRNPIRIKDEWITRLSLDYRIGNSLETRLCSEEEFMEQIESFEQGVP